MKGLLLEGDWKPRLGYKPTKWEEENHWAPDANKAICNPRVSSKTDLPDPKISGDHEVLFKIHSCGICGSDVHMVETDDEGYIILSYNVKIPFIPGHEFSGVVEEVGKSVTRVKPGDLISVEEINWCGRCLACHLGYFNQCENRTDFGFTKDGAFAEYSKVDERHCWKLDSVLESYDRNTTLEMGALTEPHGVAYEGLFKMAGGIKPGGHVVNFGAGPIGLAVIQLMRTSGAAKIICFEPKKQRRELAKESGANFAYDPFELEKKGISVHEQVLEDTNGEGAAMLVEAAGAFLKTFPEIQKCMRVGAKVVFLGMVPEKPKIEVNAFQMTGSKIYFGLGHCGGNFGAVINLMASKRIDPRKIITARFPLSKGLSALKKACEREDGKILIQS